MLPLDNEGGGGLTLLSLINILWFGSLVRCYTRMYLQKDISQTIAFHVGITSALRIKGFLLSSGGFGGLGSCPYLIFGTNSWTNFTKPWIKDSTAGSHSD